MCLSFLCAFTSSSLSIAEQAHGQELPPPGNDYGGELYGNLIEQALDEFARGRWTEARTLFARAHLISPNARTFRALGMVCFNLHQHAEAIALLEGSLAATVQPLDAALRAQVQDLLKSAEKFVARMNVELVPKQGHLRVDAQLPVHDTFGRVLLDLGSHDLSLEAEGYAAARVRLVVRTPGVQRVTLRSFKTARTVPTSLDRPETESNRKIWRWLAAGSGVAAAGVAGTTWLVASARYEELRSYCRQQNGCYAGDVDTSQIRRLDRATSTWLGIAGALVVASAVLWLVELEPRKRSRDRSQASRHREREVQHEAPR